MKRNSFMGLVGLSLVWLPAVHGMETPQEVQKEDKALPIVLVHGLKNDSSSLAKTKAILEKLAPGTKVYTPDIGFFGFAACEAQVQELTNYINSIPELENGFNLIGYSMGGIIARGALEEGKIPRVYSFVTFASPHRGVCGFPGSWDDDFDAKAHEYFKIKPLEELEKLAHKVLYPIGENVPVPVASVVDLWNEPKNHDNYLKNNGFLPLFNNEKKHKNFDAFKHNLTTVAAFACLAGTKDTTVEPWQSTRWDYCNGDRTKIVPLEESPIYDNLGLSEFGNKFSRVTIEDATHGGIHENEASIRNYVLPLLARESQRDIDGGKSDYEETNVALWRRLICCK